MGLDSLRRYDVQATCAQVLSILSTLPLAFAAFLAYRNYHADVGQIIYSSKSYLGMLLGCVALSIGMAGVGCILGFNSAGQRRNEKPARSWTGFFVGGGVLTFNVILLIAFMMMRFETPM